MISLAKMESKLHCSPAFHSKILLPVLYISLLFYTSKAATANGGNITALYAFGDSILDTGNNNNLMSLAKCNFPPYGRDFPGAVPTGRWGNGKVFSDLLADALGIKALVPAYAEPSLRSSDLRTGVCFASGGSGLDFTTVQVQNILSKEQQLINFKRTLGKLRAGVGAEQAKKIISKALFLISFGNNDIAISYFGLHLRAAMSIDVYTSQLATWGVDFVKELYNLGARRFAVMSTLPLGCLPGSRATTGMLSACLSVVNNAAVSYNSKLENSLKQVSGSLSGATLTFVDVYSPLLQIIQNPSAYGFVDAATGCCGPVCTPYDPFVCPTTSTHVFWDSAHPSEKTYRTIISQILPNYRGKF